MSGTADYWIKKLELLPHPEGGYYRENFRSNNIVDLEVGSQRAAATSIYYLLRSGDKSHLHYLAADEVWYYHAGGSAIVHLFLEDGTYTNINVGPHDSLQVVIPRGTVFGATLEAQSDFILVGCMVAPGFEFEDFKLVTKEEMLSKYPNYQQLISDLTIS